MDDVGVSVIDFEVLRPVTIWVIGIFIVAKLVLFLVRGRTAVATCTRWLCAATVWIINRLLTTVPAQ